MTFPAYPEYKDSGVEWLGEVPAHWNVSPLKWQLKNNDGGVWGNEPTGNDDTIVLRSTDQTVGGDWKIDVPARRQLTTNERRAAHLIKGDLVVTKSSGSSLHIGKTSLVTQDISDLGCCFGNFMQRLRTFESLSPKLAWYYLNNDLARRQLDVLSNSTTGLANLNGTLIGEILVSLPPRDEQGSIVSFLDHETARIDALIEEQQRLIELLKEKRQAVISHAVTKGLDPDVPMKDSGVEWLGEVPAHWRVAKLGYYADLLTGYPFPSAAFSDDPSDIRLLRGVNVGVSSLKWDDTVHWPREELAGLDNYLMPVGQIVVGMDRPWIGEGFRIARVTADDFPCLLLQRVAAVTPFEYLRGNFLFRLLESSAFKAYIEPDLTGVSVPHLSPEQILGFTIPVPPPDEQERIASFIDNEFWQTSRLLEQSRKSVELLLERRAAVVSDAVTGKIDVRGWQPPVSDTESPHHTSSELPA